MTGNQSNNQNIRTGKITLSGGSNLNMNQTNVSQSQENSITTREDFLGEIDRISDFLQNYKNVHPDVREALGELKLAKDEAQKKSPNPSAIKRFLNSAKGLIEEVAGTVKNVSAIGTAITALVKVAQIIFG